MTMRRPAGPEAARSIISSSAALLLKCAGYLEDRDHAARDDARHRDTYFAVDADVITLYLEPDRMVRYADVFGRAADATREHSAGVSAGRFLFTSKEPLVANQRQACWFLLVRRTTRNC